jgi:hypothetical protein
MHETGVKLLNLMFREGETVCVSPNQYGFHSVPLSMALSERVTLVPPNPWQGKTIEESIQYCNSSELRLVALNPIKGFREDNNCLAYRNFLVEMDEGPLKQQYDYIKALEMPYSAIVFSGGKSLHYLITLDKDLPDEKTWRKVSEWILAIVTLADPNTKNPSRSIRIPGPARDQKKQTLVEFKGPVTTGALSGWLGRYPHLIPREREKRVRMEGVDPRLENMNPWVVKVLTYGLDPTKGRNKQWFAIACEFALAGFSEDDTFDILESFYQEDRDFKRREWKSAVRSGFKFIYEGKN